MMRYLFIVLLFIGITACMDEKTPVSAEEKRDKPAVESEDLEVSADTVVDLPAPKPDCIDAELLERIGIEGETKQTIERLKRFGYTFVRHSSTENPSILQFRNSATRKDLIRTFERLPEGGFTQTLVYSCTREQLACFEANFKRDQYTLVKGAYRKKGSGSYAYSLFRIDRNACEVTYMRHLGKELMTEPVMGIDSLLLPEPR